MVVPREQDYPYSHLANEFDLGISAGTDVTELNAVVLYSDEVTEAAPDGLAVNFPVEAQVIDTGGMGTNGTRGAGGSSTPPNINDVLFGNPGSTRALFQLDHPNIETGNDQCFPIAVANSLQFLADTTDLVLPHSQVPGIKGDNSLVGQLDTAMNRTVVNRANGEGVHDIPGINGKLKYLAENGLQDRVETRHWGRYSGSADGAHTVNGRTASSVAGGLALPFDKIVDSLECGENCESAYSFPGGGHAIGLVAAGYTNGQPWIIEGSNINQASDSAGAGPQGFVFSYLKDTDKDGDYNLNGGARSWIC